MISRGAGLRWLGPTSDKGRVMFTKSTYAAAVADLRGLLGTIGRHEFRAYGYVPQLRQYRAAMRAAV